MNLLRNPEWIWRILVALGLFGMYFVQSKFVTREDFKVEAQALQIAIQKCDEKISSVDTTMKVQAARLSVLEDHEARLRALEREHRKVAQTN